MPCRTRGVRQIGRILKEAEQGLRSYAAADERATSLNFEQCVEGRRWWPGSVTKRVLCIPVQSPYECKTRGIVKLLGIIVSPGNSRHFPDAIATDPTLRQPALSP